jgi:hypothetical protein
MLKAGGDNNRYALKGSRVLWFDYSRHVEL